MSDQRPTLKPDNLPPAIKDLHQSVNWIYVPASPDSKPRKVPIHSNGGQWIDPTDPANWSCLSDAISCVDGEGVAGIGVALSGERIQVDGDDYYLVALDFDDIDIAGRESAAKDIWRRLNKPYVEISPSGNGLRMLTLCAQKPPKSGNAGDGRELYFEKRYVTLTGHSRRGKLNVSTDPLLALCDEWFGTEDPATQGRTPVATSPETPRRIARLNNALQTIDADCDYETWRNVVWGVLSTGWSVAEPMAETWSRSAPDRFSQEAFDAVVKSFDPEHRAPVTLGTVFHLARGVADDRG